MLSFDETDLLWFFEVEPEVDPYEIWHKWTVVKQGLRLTVSIWQYDNDVLISLQRDGSEQDLADIKLLDVVAISLMKDPEAHLQILYNTGTTSTGQVMQEAARITLSTDISISIGKL